MAIEFCGVGHSPLRDVSVSAPSGAVIGVIGANGAGKTALLRLAAGLDAPAQGSVVFQGSRRYVGPNEKLDLSPVDLLLIDRKLDLEDALGRLQAAVAIDQLRSNGSTTLIASHDHELLRRLSDEVWWLDHGAVAGRGDPGEVMDAYREHVAKQFRTWGETNTNPLRLAMRRGDGRAEILSLETLGETGQATMIWRSSERAAVRVTVRYREAVDDPVIGILIRTRIGLNVYGTNTELEKLKLGPCAAGQSLRIQFCFACDLCPGEYTLTAASHDPDGTAHDWIENALAFMVTDSRYTAGVANLKAQVSFEKQ